MEPLFAIFVLVLKLKFETTIIFREIHLLILRSFAIMQKMVKAIPAILIFRIRALCRTMQIKRTTGRNLKKA